MDVGAPVEAWLLAEPPEILYGGRPGALPSAHRTGPGESALGFYPTNF